MKNLALNNVDLFSRLVLASYLLFVTVFSLNNPGYNWDFLAYIGLSVSADQSQADIMHQAAYGLMRDRLSQEAFSLLLSGPVATDLYENSKHFASHLTMFEVKPLYILIVRSLSRIGVNPIDALLWLSLLPTLLTCVLIYNWLRDLMGSTLSVTVVILFSIGSRLFDVGRVAFPDALSGLMLLSGIWCLLQRKWIVFGLMIWVLSVWVRTTNILYVVPVTLFFWWNAYFRQVTPTRTDIFMRMSQSKYAICVISSIFSYFWITFRYEYSWWLLFYHSFIELQSSVSEFNEPFSFNLYWTEVTNRAMQLVTLMPEIFSFPIAKLPVFLLIFTIAMGNGEWTDTFRNFIRPYRDMGLAEAAMLGLPVFVIFLLLFPQTLIIDRFFVPYYAIFILFLASKLQHKGRTVLQE
ncbi:MAG: hypothetical protein OXF43_06345 [Gammaproteobacteria bacterium]|nr:hypothetical protein [Gammaproteobacteria bacterium]